MVKRLIAVAMAAKSDIRVESLPCFKSSAGLKTKTTATERTARMAMTMRSSTRVKPACR